MEYKLITIALLLQLCKADDGETLAFVLVVIITISVFVFIAMIYGVTKYREYQRTKMRRR